MQARNKYFLLIDFIGDKNSQKACAPLPVIYMQVKFIGHTPQVVVDIITLK